MATLKHCLACVTAQGERQTGAPLEAVVFNTLAFCQLYGISAVLKSLCSVHREHLRQVTKIHEGRARSEDS
jgi:hypothetical protein